MLSVESHSNATVNKLTAFSLSSSEAVRSSAPSVKTLPSPSPKYTKKVSLSTLAESKHTIIR